MRISLQHILGDECRLCGIKDKRVLEFDHINNNGKVDKALHVGNQNMYNWYSARPEEAKQQLQLLCANCHSIKHYGRYPERLHQNG